MRASWILILALIPIFQTTLAENRVKRQNHLKPRPSHYSKPPALLDLEDSRELQFNDSPYEYLEKKNPNRPHRHKKNHRWTDSIRYKKSRIPKRLRRRRKPKKVHSGKRPNKIRTKNSRYSDIPSTYLKPPKSRKSIYEFYSPREIPLADQPNSKPAIDSPKNHRLRSESEEESDENDIPIYVRDHAPEQQVDATDDIETNDSSETKREKSNSSTELKKDRIDFHIQGHGGPETYIFGYDTGFGNNRQFRLEERHQDGSVTGHYGYVDARGKLRKVRYKASPTQGYVEKPDESKEQKV